jgi:5'-nucleotidase
MVKPLNSFKIDLACLGNHDLDYEIERVTELKNKTNFPWLLSNVHDKHTGLLLAGCE